MVCCSSLWDWKQRQQKQEKMSGKTTTSSSHAIIIIMNQHPALITRSICRWDVDWVQEECVHNSSWWPQVCYSCDASSLWTCRTQEGYLSGARSVCGWTPGCTSISRISMHHLPLFPHSFLNGGENYLILMLQDVHVCLWASCEQKHEWETYTHSNIQHTHFVSGRQALA